MRTTFPFAVFMSLVVVLFAFQASGFNAVVGIGDGAATDQAERQFDEDADGSLANASDYNGDGEVSVDAGGSRESDNGFFATIVAGGETLVSVLSTVVLLPMLLRNIGFPVWITVPMSVISGILMTIGSLQFILGRTLK